MDNPIDHRVIKLELRVDNHENELKELKDTSTKMQTALSSIEKTLAQIKWLAAGALLAYVFQALGLKETLKLLL